MSILAVSEHSQLLLIDPLPLQRLSEAAMQASVPRYFVISQPTQKNHPKQAPSSSESSWNMSIQLYEVDTISNSRNANDYEKVTYP